MIKFSLVHCCQSLAHIYISTSMRRIKVGGGESQKRVGWGGTTELTVPEVWAPPGWTRWKRTPRKSRGTNLSRDWSRKIRRMETVPFSSISTSLTLWTWSTVQHSGRMICCMSRPSYWSSSLTAASAKPSSTKGSQARTECFFVISFLLSRLFATWQGDILTNQTVFFAFPTTNSEQQVSTEEGYQFRPFPFISLWGYNQPNRLHHVLWALGCSELDWLAGFPHRKMRGCWSPHWKMLYRQDYEHWLAVFHCVTSCRKSNIFSKVTR